MELNSLRAFFLFLNVTLSFKRWPDSPVTYLFQYWKSFPRKCLVIMAPQQLSITCSHPTSFQSGNVLTILDQDISREVKNYEFLCESKGSLVVKLWTFNAFFSQILKENLGIGYVFPVTAILKFPNSRTHFEVSVQIPLKFWNATDRTRIRSLNKFTST